MDDAVDQVEVLHEKTVLVVVVLVVGPRGRRRGWQSKVEPIELVVGMMQVAWLLLLVATFHDRLVHCLVGRAVLAVQLLL